MRYREHAKPPVFSHNELLITITLYSDTIKTALWLQDSLRVMVDEETAARNKLRAAIPNLNETLLEEDVPEGQYQCCVCKGFCYLSQVTCSCTKLVSCFEHIDLLCECAWTERTLRLRFSEDQLQDILEAVESRATQPEAWESRLDTMLEVARPQLKTIRQLVADGERIPHPLPGLSELRAFLDRANAWVERATAIFTRKSTGRRRKGRQSEPAPVEDDDVDRSPKALRSLIAEAERLSFDTPEISQLRQVVDSMDQFATDAADILSKSDEDLNYETCKTALILGESLNLDLPVVAQLRTVVNRLQWFHKINEEVDDRTLQYSDILHLLAESKQFGVPENDPQVVELQRRETLGRQWKQAVDALLSSESITIEAVTELIEGREYTPTSIETMRQLEHIRKTATGWQTQAAALLKNRGSSAAAQRLVKQVKSANGPLGRMAIREVSKLAKELERINVWLESIADTLNIAVKNVPLSVNNLAREVDEHLAPGDDTINSEHSCFCRAPPLTNMIACPVCDGSYHPKCVGINAKTATAIKAASENFQCQMCRNLQYDDRPSFHELALHVDPVRWRFALHPPEWDSIRSALDHTVRYAAYVVRHILKQNPSRDDVPEIAHLLRKIWTLPIQLDALNHSTNKVVVFEHWLYHRLRELTDPGSAAKASGNNRTRARKPRFDFERAFSHQFSCLCASEPPDHPLKVQCSKCEQGFHLSCVQAPINQANVEGRSSWKCPFCIVKSGKAPVRGLELRVQMKGEFARKYPSLEADATDKIGTDEHVDWRQSIYVYSKNPITYKLPPNPDAITLIATTYHGPALPEGFERPAWTADEIDRRRKRRKTDPAPSVSAPASATASPSIRLVHNPAPVASPSRPPGYAPHLTLPPPPAHSAAPSGHMGPPQATSASGVPLQNVPAQNVRASGGHFYPTHKAVPWDNSNMFSQFQLPAGVTNGAPVLTANGPPAEPARTAPIATMPPSSSRVAIPVSIPPPSLPVLTTAPAAYATTLVPSKRELPVQANSGERSPKRAALASPQVAASGLRTD